MTREQSRGNRSGAVPRGAGALPLVLLLASACAPPAPPPAAAPARAAATGERVQVLEPFPGVTATLVAPAALAADRPVELVIYALPNGNSTAETIGRAREEGVGWRHDIQHIGAQTRYLRARGLDQVVVAYLEADTRSWPEWRRLQGRERAAARIVALVDVLRATVRGSGTSPRVTLAGHSGGGAFAWALMDGYTELPAWLERIALLDSNYSFEPEHGDKLAQWLQRSAANTLVVLAYDDREVTLEGRKVVSETGGTWRATHRMLDQLRGSFPLTEGRLGEFLRYHGPGIEVLLHPNPENRILHTALIGEMNGYAHALLVRRPAYERGEPVLKNERVYGPWIEGDVALPPPVPPAIPARARDAITGTAFIAAVAELPLDEREAAIRRELLAGNIPSFLRRLRTVRVSALDAAGVERTLEYDVMPDYLAIGSDEDFVRMPMDPYTAQAFCDAFGFVLPTRRVVDLVWAAADVHVEPRPLTEARESPLTFLQHHRIIEERLAGTPRGVFVAGIKKDVVLSNRLLERAARVAIYGWHYPNGEPIQPVYAGHVDWYVDYSHGIRPVRRRMRLDGAVRTFEEVLADPQLRALLSDEGELRVLRYERQ